MCVERESEKRCVWCVREKMCVCLCACKREREEMCVCVVRESDGENEREETHVCEETCVWTRGRLWYGGCSMGC